MPNCCEVVAMVALGGRYGRIIVASYIGTNKAVSLWLPVFLNLSLVYFRNLTFTCGFHMRCTNTAELIDMHKG